LKKRKKPLPHHQNAGPLALQLLLGVGKFINLDVGQLLNPNQHQLLPHQVGLHLNLNLTPRAKIRLSPVNLKEKAKRKRTSHLILLKPLPRARKRLKLRLKLRKRLLH